MMGNKIDFSFFDEMHDRRNTNAVKFDVPKSAKYGEDIIPMWIADMDFKTPPMVEKRLQEVAARGIFGYTVSGRDYFEALTNWYKKRMDWDFAAEQTVQTPGVMFGVSAAINALTEKGDGVLIFQPVYYPFQKVVENNGRKCVVSRLRLEDGVYRMDLAETERLIAENSVKMLLLCSPHNPVGRVWEKEELRELAALCLKHKVWLVADEIHSDFVYGGRWHTPLATLSAEIADRTITCTAPSKTFNLAGLQVANMVITNAEARRKIQKVCEAQCYHCLNTMAAEAAAAAYRYGEPWLNTLLLYLENNIKILREALADTDLIKLVPPQGTYLLWLDCRKLGLDDKSLQKFFADEAGLWLHSGGTFGAGGEGFVRMNIACPVQTLRQAIDRLQKALQNNF